MSDVAILIADLVRAGVDPDLVGRTAEAIASAAKVDRPARSSASYPDDEWESLRRSVFERDGYTCVYCGEDVADAPQCDHVVPLIQGGPTILSNLATACKRCNSSKSGRSPEEWRAGWQ